MKPEEIHSIVVAKLRGLRAEKNLTLEEVGSQISVGRDTLSLYELGKRKLPLVILLQLLQFYNVDIDIFFKNVLDNSR